MKAPIVVALIVILGLACRHTTIPSSATRPVDGPFTVFGRVTDESGNPLQPYQPQRVDFVLAPAASVVGVLIDGNDQPLGSRRIFLGGEQLPPSSSALAWMQTDSAGRFHFDAIPTTFAWHFGTRIPNTFTEPLTPNCRFDRPQQYRVRLALRPQPDGDLELHIENIWDLRNLDDRR